MATFTVTTLLDEAFDGSGDASDGAGLSLREALGLANANGAAEADEITFAAGLAGGTLFLTSKQELAITTNGITVNGDTNGDGRPTSRSRRTLPPAPTMPRAACSSSATAPTPRSGQRSTGW